MQEKKQCPECWGRGRVCVGLRDNLEPITVPCPVCGGTGKKGEEQYINCACGTKIEPKRGAIQVNCRCGRVYRLCKDGKVIYVSGS